MSGQPVLKSPQTYHVSHRACSLPSHTLTQGVSVKHECQERLQPTTHAFRVGFYFTLTETKGGLEWIVM